MRTQAPSAATIRKAADLVSTGKLREVPVPIARTFEATDDDDNSNRKYVLTVYHGGNVLCNCERGSRIAKGEKLSDCSHMIGARFLASNSEPATL